MKATEEYPKRNLDLAHEVVNDIVESVQESTGNGMISVKLDTLIHVFSLD